MANVAVSAAALQLLPANASRLLRLRRLAAMAAAGVVEEPRPPTPSWLRSRLSQPPVGGEDVAAQDVRYDDVITKEIAYPGGPFLVLQGAVSGSGDLCQTLLDVLQVRRDDFPAPFVAEAKSLATVLLRLSDTVCRRAGLLRHAHAGLMVRNTPDVPAAAALRRLERCLTFNMVELGGLLPSSCVETVQRLAILPGDLVFDHLTELSPDAHVSVPLLWTPEALVVASPTELVTTFRHHVFSAAMRHGCLDHVARSLQERAHARVDVALRGLGYRPAEPGWDETDDGVATRTFTQTRLPTARVVVISDLLNGYDENKLFTQWTTSQTQTDQAVDLLDVPLAEGEQAHDFLRLIVQAGAGRYAFFGLRDVALDSPLLMLQLSDLETLTDLADFDAASLWFFAKAEGDLHDRSRVMTFNLLDNYATYRKHELSYYIGDDRPGTLVVFEAADGRAVREDVATRRDRHRRADPNDMLTPVISRHGTDVAPLYYADPAYAAGVHVAELGQWAAWVTPADADEAALTTFLRNLAEALAYWIWQTASTCPEWLATWPDNVLDCHVQVDNPTGWADLLQGTTDAPPEQGEPFAVARIDGRRMTVTARLNAALRLRNTAAVVDRDLVTALLNALPAPDLTSDEALDRIVPSGTKRMLHVVSPGAVLHQPGNLPRARLRRQEASSLVLDLAADWLSTSSWPEGPVAEHQRCNIINDVVSFYYDTLVARIATFEPTSLRRTLIALDEALLHSEARREYMLPARIAAFGAGAAPVEELYTAQSRATSSAVASRFLIEYVAAAPPQGQRVMTAIDYDLLLAIASEIVTRGQLSDAIKHGFAEVQVSVLPSRRLGVSRDDTYTHASEAHGRAYVSDQRNAILRPAEGADGAADFEATRSSDLDGDLAEAMRAEFGFTFDELAQFLIELIVLCNEHSDAEPLEMPVQKVVARLRSALAWSDEKIRTCLSRLELAPRTNFLTPAREVMPWLYTRDLSYVRRPLVRVATESGDTYVFARRRLWQTHGYWRQLILTGRLRGESQPMKRLLGRLRQEENREFEREVAKVLGLAGYEPSLHGVARVRGRRLADEQHNDLGDIDALAIDARGRVVVVAEAKDFQIGRTAPELAHEADALLRHPNSAAVKLRRRADWVRRNLPGVLEHAGVQSDSRGWEIRPVIVTSQDLLSGRILSGEVPIVPMTQLAAWASPRARSSQRRSRR